MLRLAIFIAALSCVSPSLFAENAAEILDPNAPVPEKKSPVVPGPAGTVDEPGFKASVRVPNQQPSPNFDLGTKNTNQIAVPKNKAWSVPLEEGFAGRTNPSDAASEAASADKNQAVAENISPALANAIAREKAGSKPAEMIPVYRAIVNSEKENAAPHYRLGLALVHAGELQNGLVELETVISMQPKNPRYLCDFGIAALRAGWVEKAFAACQAAVSVSPNTARYHSALGDVHLAAQHIPEAVEAYTRAVKLDPDNSVYFYNLGLAYMHGREFKRATELFEEAIRIKPTSSTYFCSLGLACENLKNIKRAMEYYLAAIKLDKTNAYAHYLYAGIFSDPDDPTYTNRFEAVEHAEKAVKLTNYKNALYLMGLARALRVAHNYEQATDIAKKAVELEPSRADYRKELAEFEEGKMQGLGKEVKGSK